MSLRDAPFRTMLALGESTVAGACATAPERRWVNVTASLIEEFQGAPLTLHNRGIGANAISPRSPGYERSAKPSAMERYRDDVIALEPDLFVLAYGLNDMRAGMPADEFADDLRTIVREVRAPVTVLTTVYHMSRYDWYPPYDRGSAEITERYNHAIAEIASDERCILADAYAAQGRADWVVHPDTVHANDLGHRLIGHRVFEAIVTNCRGAAARIDAEMGAERAKVDADMQWRLAPQNYDSTNDPATR